MPTDPHGATGLTLERCHDVLRWLVPGAVGETHTGQGDCYKCQRVYDRITQTGEFAADPHGCVRLAAFALGAAAILAGMGIVWSIRGSRAWR